MLINSECFWTFDSIDIDFWAIVISSHNFSFVFFLAKSMKGRYHCNYLCKYCDWRDFLKFRAKIRKWQMVFSCRLNESRPALEIRWFVWWVGAGSVTNNLWRAVVLIKDISEQSCRKSCKRSDKVLIVGQSWIEGYWNNPTAIWQFFWDKKWEINSRTFQQRFGQAHQRRPWISPSRVRAHLPVCQPPFAISVLTSRRIQREPRLA